MKKIIFLICLFYQNCFSQNTYSPNGLISKDKIEEDFKIFRKSLEEAHPSLYSYTSKAQFDSKFDSVSTLLNKDMGEMEFYNILSYLVSEIKDGHTQIIPSKVYLRFLSTNALLFPFYLVFVDERAFIILNGSDASNIVIGSELLSIGGKSIKEIMQVIYMRISSDSNIQSRKKWVISQNFNNYFHYFFGEQKEMEINYKNQITGQIETTTIKALPLINILSNIRSNPKNRRSYRYFTSAIADENKPLKLEFLNQNQAACLTVGTFLDLNKLKFTDFLKDAFYMIHIYKAKNLIIDLRNNNGGLLTNAKLLYAYLTEEDFKANDTTFWNGGAITFKEHTNIKDVAKYEKSIQILRKHFDTDSSTQQYISEANENKLFLKLKKSIKHRFSGKVYFLVNGGTFSAANLFSVLGHFYKRGIFIGEETGGNYYESTGHFSKNPLNLILPNSHIRLIIPTVKFSWSVNGYPYKDRGVIPEYVVLPDVRDLVYGEDTVLGFVMQLIAK